MRLRRWLVGGAQALLLMLVLPHASAHLMTAGQGAVRLVGDSAYAVISLPASSLAGFDDNHDGLIDLDELNAHRASIDRQVSNMLEFRDGAQPGRLIFSDLLLSHAEDSPAKGLDHLVVMRRYQWDAPIRSFHLRADIFNTTASGGAPLLVRVIQGERSEAAAFSRQNKEADFFVGTWTTLLNFVIAGAEHILLGIDHLLFLLTVLVVGAGWRYWLAMVTSFTVAHSATLTLAAFGLVSAPSQLVEPLIAASIVLMASYNLLRGQGVIRHRVALVFACGLLHGLGLASVLSDIGLSTQSRVLSLAGFNLGVELGQMGFVAVMLALLHLARRRMPMQWHGRLIQGCSVFAAVAGTGWMIDRTLSLI